MRIWFKPCPTAISVMQEAVSAKFVIKGSNNIWRSINNFYIYNLCSPQTWLDLVSAQFFLDIHSNIQQIQKNCNNYASLWSSSRSHRLGSKTSARVAKILMLCSPVFIHDTIAWQLKKYISWQFTWRKIKMLLLKLF